MMYSRLRQEGLSCITLEMFFGSYPRMVGLNHFPNLQILRIVGQAVRKIEGLRFLPKLKELWIIECNLKVSTVGHVVGMWRLRLGLAEKVGAWCLLLPAFQITYKGFA